MLSIPQHFTEPQPVLPGSYRTPQRRQVIAVSHGLALSGAPQLVPSSNVVGQGPMVIQSDRSPFTARRVASYWPSSRANSSTAGCSSPAQSTRFVSQSASFPTPRMGSGRR